MVISGSVRWRDPRTSKAIRKYVVTRAETDAEWRAAYRANLRQRRVGVKVRTPHVPVADGEGENPPPVPCLPAEQQLAAEVREATGREVRVNYWKDGAVDWDVAGLGRIGMPRMIELTGKVTPGIGL
jgi:hypothetical protein